ncbi:MAG: MFS transporter [Sphingomonadaceae bacterium]
MVSDASGTVPAKGARYVALVLLMIVYAFNYLDRQIVSVLAEPIKNDLHLSDAEIGMLGGLVFALFYTAFGIPLAYMADRYHRVRIISASCAIWSLFTASCGLATGFATLALARIGVGIGEAGGTPPSHSILADYFPPEKRGGALALYSLGVPIGTTLGTMIGAWVAAEHGWRTAFLAVGLPGLAAALVVLLFVREPERGRLDRI